MHALTSYAPKMDGSKTTVNFILRDLLRAAAPVYLWKFSVARVNLELRKAALPKRSFKHRGVLTAATDRTSLNYLTTIFCNWFCDSHLPYLG